MSIAFTKIPEDFDVANLIDAKHARLFDQGLDEADFDRVAGHLVATLKDMQVPQNLIDEVVGVVGPLRGVFEQGAVKAAQRKKQRQIKSGLAAGAVVAAVAATYLAVVGGSAN